MRDKKIRMFISCTWRCNPDACKKKVKFFNQHGLLHEFIEPYNEDLIIKNGESDVSLDKKMKQSDCLLILNGVDLKCEKWLEKELELANKYGVPVVAISPWKHQKTNPKINNVASVNVGWHGKLITEAIFSLFD